jgi:hypothetical protein
MIKGIEDLPEGKNTELFGFLCVSVGMGFEGVAVKEAHAIAKVEIPHKWNVEDSPNVLVLEISGTCFFLSTTVISQKLEKGRRKFR